MKEKTIDKKEFSAPFVAACTSVLRLMRSSMRYAKVKEDTHHHGEQYELGLASGRIVEVQWRTSAFFTSDAKLTASVHLTVRYEGAVCYYVHAAEHEEEALRALDGLRREVRVAVDTQDASYLLDFKGELDKVPPLDAEGGQED